jgi:hypothetical protein
MRRTLSGLTPKAAAPKSEVRQLIRSNRTEAVAPKPTPEEAGSFLPATVTAESATSAMPESVTNRVPKYLRLKRREARVYAEQADELTLLTRRLNSARRLPDGTTTGERITDNTLLRLAIDLLLARTDDLKGTTEEELAASLGLNPRKPGDG